MIYRRGRVLLPRRSLTVMKDRRWKIRFRTLRYQLYRGKRQVLISRREIV